MDTNGDKRISYSEFSDFLEQTGYKWILNDPNFFKKLDRNRDGGLDFEEVLTFYYIIKTSCVMCRGCSSVYLCGLYFTCVACFDGADHKTYDLCAVAIATGILITIIHTFWITIYCYGPKDVLLLLLPVQVRENGTQHFRLLEAGLATENLVTTVANCAIM
ncbi:hypothetical protein ACLB2K_038333 [Fragaria x ananassa]